MASRSEIEETVTDSIIRALESGVAPWRKPWSADSAMPVSASTNKPYRGINVLILWAVAAERGYDQPYWMTLKQANALGGKVRKGERSTEVVFWKVLKTTQKDAETGEMVPANIPLLRTYRVFNVAQIDGLVLPPRFQPKVGGEPVEVLAGLQTIIDGYEDGPSVVHTAGDRAFYRPATDSINLPKRSQFETAEGYAETLLHEFVHSTGHKDRLDRFEAGQERFGCEGYAKEELVAEIGAAMLTAIAGIDLPVDQPAAYVASWLKVLKDDRSLVIKAAQQAQKAVDRIAPVKQAEQEEVLAEAA